VPLDAQVTYKPLLQGTVQMPCRQLNSALFIRGGGGAGDPLSFASGCNHDGVITSVRRVASTWQCVAIRLLDMGSLFSLSISRDLMSKYFVGQCHGECPEPRA
jgi:hypothetical protein